MQRFILQSNIERFQALLDTESREGSRVWLTGMIAAARRELAMLNAAVTGVRTGPAPLGPRLARAARIRGEFQRALEASDQNLLILEPGPGLHIIDVSDLYARSTLVERSAVAGELMFDIFPDNPQEPTADGVSNLYASLRLAAETGRPQAMQIQRYDVRDAEGRFVEKHWRPLNTPVFDDDGHLTYIIHKVEDVTSLVRAGQAPAVAA